MSEKGSVSAETLMDELSTRLADHGKEIDAATLAIRLVVEDINNRRHPLVRLVYDIRHATGFNTAAERIDRFLDSKPTNARLDFEDATTETQERLPMPAKTAADLRARIKSLDIASIQVPDKRQ